jgi:hypothetical protein
MQQTKRGRVQDRRQVAAGQEHEVRYEAKKVGATTTAVKRSVGRVGNSRRKVEADLKKD